MYVPETELSVNSPRTRFETKLIPLLKLKKDIIFNKIIKKMIY